MDVNIVPSSRRGLISSTILLLRFLFLFNNEINGTGLETSLLQYFSITFSTLSATLTYTRGIGFRNVSVFLLLLVVEYIKQESNAFVIFINELFYAS